MGIIDELPEGRNLAELQERGNRIVDAVRDGHGQFEWATVTTDVGGHRLVWHPMADALQIEGVRVNVSATDSQRIADLLGAMLPTARLADWLYEAAPAKLAPQPRPISATTAAMVEHSAAVDRAVAANPPASLVADPGKAWILTSKLWQGASGIPPGELAANFGWHVPGPVWQGINANRTPEGLWAIQGGPTGGTRHDRRHVDYSQVAQLIRRDATLDGQPVDLAAMLVDADLAHLISSDGPLPEARQPGVPLEPGGAAGPAPPSNGEGGRVVEIEPVTIEAGPPDDSIPQARIARAGPTKTGVVIIASVLALGALAAALGRG
ncbi:MAG: hypothetical protein DWQ35_00375 [Planctomycetota bacterium]|nr:MAG: hypothetical protein DWQ35_00375 [Planctomycetota bacterium]